jgi:hypothetical protein
MGGRSRLESIKPRDLAIVSLVALAEVETGFEEVGRISNGKSASLQRLVGQCWRVYRHLRGETSYKPTSGAGVPSA